MTLISVISSDLISTLLTVIGIIFGVVGVVSKTKKAGKLTFGGLLVISGIIIIGILTLIKEDVDKKKIAAEKQEAIEEKVRNLILENVHYNTTLNKIDSTLKRTDTIQLRTSDLLGNIHVVNKRSDSLNSREILLLKEQEVLLGRQNDIGANIIRSFNPLQPFQVSIELDFKITSDLINSKILGDCPSFFATCLAFDRAFVHRSGGAAALSESILRYPGMGFVSSAPLEMHSFLIPTINKIECVSIAPQCFPYKKMPNFGLQFFIDLRENRKNDSTVHYGMAYQLEKGLPTDSILYYVTYNCVKDSYEISFSLTNLRVFDEDGKVKSGLDFKKYAAYCMLFIQNMPLTVKFKNLQINFPPDYSQSMRADLNNNCKYYCYRDSLPSISILTHFISLHDR